MKRKLTDTSLDANDSMTSDIKERHYEKILTALKQLGSANYETISLHLGMKNANQVSRRTKEMVLCGLILKTENKSKTTSGRQAYDYIVNPDSNGSTTVFKLKPVTKEKINKPVKVTFPKSVNESANLVAVTSYVRAKPNHKETTPVQSQPSLLDFLNQSNESDN